MKLLQLNREFFIWQKLYPTGRFEGRMKYLPVLASAVLLVNDVVVLVTCSLFIYYNLQENLEYSLQALLELVGEISVIYMWIVTFVIQNQLTNSFARFQDIYDKSIRNSFF